MRTGDSRLDPCEVAALDQVVAEYTRWLRQLAASYELSALAEGDLVTLTVTTDWLTSDFDQQTLASLLAVSVRMLSGR